MFFILEIMQSRRHNPTIIKIYVFIYLFLRSNVENQAAILVWLTYIELSLLLLEECTLGYFIERIERFIICTYIHVIYLFINKNIY